MTKLYATAALGTADLVAAELKALGFSGVRYDAGGASFEAGGDDPRPALMRACLHLRAGLRVLWPLARFKAHDGDAVYEGAAAVAWEEHLAEASTFAVSASSAAPPPLAHEPYLAQRVKDAVVDRLRARRGARPDVSRADPDVRVYLRLDAEGAATVGLDASGTSLHERGYRTEATAAPLRETLAAALILASGWDGDRPLVDPMCGSGTIVIEAARRALRVAPGSARRFGFERWPGFDAASWRRLLDEAGAAARTRLEVELVGRDRDPEAVETARRNAARALPGGVVRWEVADARDLTPLVPPGVVASNPPYGERLDAPGVRAFWRTLGRTLRGLDGHTAYLLVRPEMMRDLGMRPSWERRMKNGPLTVTLARFELGRGGGASGRRRDGHP